jgi:tetratricopeptide (TPR) repeat protein
MRWKTPLFRPVVLLACFGFGAAPSVRAGDEWPVPRGPAREPAAYKYEPTALEGVPKAFLEEHAGCYLYSGNIQTIEADGTVEASYHEVIRLNGRKGIDNLGEYRTVTFDTTYEKVTLHEARVHKADGRTVALQPRDARVRDDNTDYASYSNVKQLILSFPGLEAGDVMEVRWTVRGKNPEDQGQFYYHYTFGNDRYPVAREEFSVRLPKGKTFKHKLLNGGAEATSRIDGELQVHSWRAADQLPLPQDDGAPLRTELRPQVACSTFASWEEVDRWNRQVYAGRWECPPEARAVVRELTKDLKTPEEKARALTYWVRRNVRYLAVGVHHAFTPHPPAFVCANRYGDCKDQSQLLAVMLREAGIPVSLVSLSVRGDGQVQEAVPSPGASHAIVLVRLGGKDHWIDPVYSEAGWDFLPQSDRDVLTYVMDVEAAVKGENSIKLLRTPALRAEDNRTEVASRVRLGPSRHVVCEETVTHHGHAALRQRELWLEVANAERRRLVTEELQNSETLARLKNLTIDEKSLRDFDKPVTAKIEFEYPAELGADQLPEATIAANRLFGKVLAQTLDFAREVSYNLQAPFDFKQTYVVEVPAAYRLGAPPESATVRSRWGTFTRTRKSADDDATRLELHFHMRVTRTRVEPSEFEAFRKFQREVLEKYRVYLSLNRVTDLEDADALEKALKKAPNDIDTARVLAGLYQAHGKLEDARRVVQAALAQAPQDRELLELAVKVAQDREKAAAKERAAAQLRLARLHLGQGNAAQASTELEAAEAADPDCLKTVEARVLQGEIYEKLSRTEQAREGFEQALVLAADNPEALAGLLRLALAEDKRPEALTLFRRYVIAAGTDGGRLANAAEFALRLNRLDDALDLAGQAKGDRAERVLGLAHARRGEFEQALGHLEKAALDAEALTALLNSALAVGRLDRAEEFGKRKDKVRPSTPELADVVRRVQELARRRAVLVADVRVPREKAAAWATAIDHYLCTELALAEGRPSAQVEVMLSGAFAEGVDVPAAFGLRARLLVERGRLAQALADADHCLGAAAKDANALYARGRVRLERAQAGALADLEKAAELSQRKDAAVLHWLAAALFQAGKFKEAVEAQSAAVKLKPHERELTEQLRKFEEAAGAGEASGKDEG